MSDADLRELERRFRATGSLEDEAAWLFEQLRSGATARLSVELEAVHGSQAARLVLADLPDRLLVIHFWAEWNQHDRGVWSDLLAMRSSVEGWLLHRCNIDDEDFARVCRILSIPTLIGFRRGVEVARHVGAEGVEAWLRAEAKAKPQPRISRRLPPP